MRHRRGTIYIAVMGVTIIVAAIGLSIVQVARLQLRSVQGTHDLKYARELAQSGVEFGLGRIDLDPAWRTTYTSGTEISPVINVGSGTMTFKLIDETDGDMANNDLDPVRVYGIGRVGSAVYVESALLEPAGAGLTCLEASFHTSGQLSFDDAVWTTDQFVSTNLSTANAIMQVGTGILNGNAEAVGTIQNPSVTGTQTEGITPRQMPVSSAFDYYIANGTAIDINDLPGGVLEKVVLSPGNNPYGSGITNPQGIYVIDCNNQFIRISMVRLVGTLVLLNPGVNSELADDQHWESAISNSPVLMVDGNIRFNWTSENTLRESVATVNYNPSHTPYQDQSDADTTDEYPGVIKGLIYVSGNLDIQHQCVIDGVVVTGAVVAQGDMDLTFDPVFLANPPPGFRNGDVVTISPGTWRREPSP